MKTLLVLILVLVTVLFAGLAIASVAQGNLTWDAPTQNSDGTPLPSSQIAGYDIICTFKPNGGGASSPCSLDKTTFAGAAVSGQVTVTYPAIGGSAEFQIRVTRTDTVQSPYTAVTTKSTKILPPVGPNAPTNLTVVSITFDVQINLNSGDGFNRSVAYTVTSSGPGPLVAVTKIGTPCIGEKKFTYRGQDYYEPLPVHPRTGASNIAWIKGVDKSKPIASPCAA